MNDDDLDDLMSSGLSMLRRSRTPDEVVEDEMSEAIEAAEDSVSLEFVQRIMDA